MTLHHPVHAHAQSGPHIGQSRSNAHEYCSEHWSHGSKPMSQVSMSGLQLQLGAAAETTRQERTRAAICGVSGSAFFGSSSFGPAVTNSSAAAFAPRTATARLNVR